MIACQENLASEPDVTFARELKYLTKGCKLLRSVVGSIV